MVERAGWFTLIVFVSVFCASRWSLIKAFSGQILLSFLIQSGTVEPVKNGHSKIDETKVFMTNGRLMKVESIALSDNWSWSPVFFFFESSRFTIVYAQQSHLNAPTGASSYARGIYVCLNLNQHCEQRMPRRVCIFEQTSFSHTRSGFPLFLPM